MIRGSTTRVTFKFKPSKNVTERSLKKLLNFVLFLDHDVADATKRIHAVIGAIPFPWIGVDGKSACDNIYTTEGQPGCPMKANQTYVYNEDIEVLKVYPTVSINFPKGAPVPYPVLRINIFTIHKFSSSD